MSKFNQQQTMRTTNKSGHAAYKMTDRAKLVTQVLTSFFNEAKFYGDNSAEMQQTIKRVIAQGPEFVAKLAVFARREFNMRSVSHVLAAYLAHEVEGKPYARRTIEAVCLRGDDATEILAFYLATFGKPIPNSLRRGLKHVLGRFDSYTMAKYKGDGKAVKMRDLVNVCRPKPGDRFQSAYYKALLESRLEPPATWEYELSHNGNNRETWERLIDGGRVGYMALLRNLRNILNVKPGNIDAVLDKLADPEAVRKSKQLPFRFLSAYKAVQDIASSRVLDALEKACAASVANMERLPGLTVIAVDMSGSMSSPVSEKSTVRCCEIGALLGMIANRICEDSVFYEFNNYASKVPVSASAPLLYSASQFRCGGGTNMAAPFERMIKDGVKAGRVIVISDNECNIDRSWWGSKTVQAVADEYRHRTGCDCWVHAIDLQGYGAQQFAGPKTNIIAGWSEKIFDFIRLAEQGEGSLEKAIEQYEY